MPINAKLVIETGDIKKKKKNTPSLRWCTVVADVCISEMPYILSLQTERTAMHEL